MLRRICILLAVVLAVGVPLTPRAEAGTEYQAGSVHALVDGEQVVLGNDLVERRWERATLVTTALEDRRAGGGATVATSHRDFTLDLVGGVELGSDAFTVDAVAVENIDGGLRVRFELTGPLGLGVTRIVEAYEGIAGFRSQTILRPLVPTTLAGYTLDELAAGEGRQATVHALRAGADWREPGWAGPQVAVGDPHGGTWRESTTGAPGAAVAGPAQWVSVTGPAPGGASAFLVAERNDQPSTQAGYDGAVVSASVDLSRDIVVAGPFEEQVHVENPTAAPGRVRVLAPGAILALEPVFTGLAVNPDDEPAQFAAFLAQHRLVPYQRAVVFNSNGTDGNVISTGAKDDVDFDTILEIAPIARALGVETFVLDDGWQARSGDWYPDSPEHPEPRWDGDPASPFAPRFPDAEFAAVREAIAPMRLGLWMSPMHFNPASATYQAHPEWACAPVGHGLAAYNQAQPDDGSNEAGIGTWGPAAIPHVESRIREAIESWGVVYFKFDFLVWLDCAGQGDLYDYREAFLAMLDRLQGDHPAVTFEIDETNDYRLFPYESVSRGPSWFQNGTPPPQRLLHNLWNLSPFVPTSSIGQAVLGGRAWEQYPIDTLLAAALPSHITVFSDLRNIPPEVIDATAPWLAFYRQHRQLLGGMAYPLLDDPLAGGWTALQPWDPVAEQGSLLVFRQGSPEANQTVALRHIPPGRTYDLLEAPSGSLFDTVSSAELQAGIDIELPEPDTARVLLVVPSGSVPTPGSGAGLSEPVGTWLAGDLHVHTCYSHDAYCGPDDDNTGPEEAYILSAPVEERFVEAAARGLDYLAITDHNDVRSVTDPGFGSHGVLGIPGYEASLDGHAQMLGAREVLDRGDGSAAAIQTMADELRAGGGVFQINHPAEPTGVPFTCDQTDVLDWGYGYDVVPDTVEVWNISHLYQHPLPSASSNSDAIAYWECWLEAGHHVGATGGSDSHWVSTTAVQGPGNPTTWVFARGTGATAVLDGLRAGRTAVSVVPPAAGGVRLLLEADVDGDGTYESMVGDEVPPGTAMRVRVDGAGGGLVDVRANGVTIVDDAHLAPGVAVSFTSPADRAWGWVRATLSAPEPVVATIGPMCQARAGDRTSYCRDRVGILALTSPIYLA